MKKLITVLLFVIAVSTSLSTRVWAHGMGFGGGGHSGHFGGSHFSGGSGHFGGSFHGGFGRHGGHFGFGSPFVFSPGADHFQHFQHEQFFGPHHHFGLFVPFGHEQHLLHEQFFGLHHHFGPGFGFHSFGPGGFGFHPFIFSDQIFVFGNGFGAAGPPPLGAAGPTPFAPADPRIGSFPFFCAPHGFGFNDQAQFFAHLNFAHRIPLDRAASFCTPVGDGSRLMFFGF